MISLNQYKLLGFLSMLLAVDAWFLDAFNGDEPQVHYPEPRAHYQEPVVHYQEPLPVAQHGYHPEPVYTAPQVDVYKYEPLKVEQVWKEEVLERAFNEIYAVPLITSDTWYSTVTDTKYFTAVGYQRATVTVTPPAIYKTLTKIMSTVSMVEAAGIRTQKLWISETLIMGTTTTRTSTTWRTSTTRNYQPVTVEEQITQTVWEQFTVTSTGLATVTEWETRPYELLQVHRVRVPVVSIITATTRLPHHKTMTKWITRTLTSTIACVKSHYPQPQQGYAAPQPVYPQPQQGYAAPQPVYPHH